MIEPVAFARTDALADPLGRQAMRGYISVILFGLSLMAERAGDQTLSTQLFDIAEALVEPVEPPTSIR